jgi:pyruvate formate lyase activating enzyme
MKRASYFTPLENRAIRCDLCPHRCTIPENGRGICLTRENHGGTLFAANYCRPVSTAIDPIEKKPLYHFYPGSSIFSTGPNGCNFKCSFCQNHEISQQLLDVPEVKADRLLRAIAESGTLGVAYTYSEPLIWFETIMEIGPRVKELGLKNILVTNGFIEEAPLRELLPFVDAMNIDVKSMNPDFYRRICKGSLAPELRTCETAKKVGCHIEITNLLIPGENDKEEETVALARFIAESLGADTPLHISRYFPRYRMDHPPTPEQTLDRAWEVASERLDFVYLGNMRSGGKEDTRCSQCNEILVVRRGYETKVCPMLEKGVDGKAKCGKCGRGINVLL